MVIARKGAISPSKVPKDILKQLESGLIETVNLSESLAIDFAPLLANTFPKISKSQRLSIDQKAGITKRMSAAAALIESAYGADSYQGIKSHQSDTVRGWSAYLLCGTPGMTIQHRLRAIKCLADDPHFGVREWAWLALRPHIATDLEKSIKLLTPWVKQKSPRVRRFAVEITRPRGVWCSHLPALKTDPSPGLALLEPLRADPDRYVQDSVANWLNDASKTNKVWVKSVCKNWLKEDEGKSTSYICRRAQRSC